MSISNISQAGAPALAALAPTAKTAAASAAVTSEAAPDKDASAAKSSTASAPNMYKLNPDGTVGPLHLHRSRYSPGVVHA
jgi:hypothetical protein